MFLLFVHIIRLFYRQVCFICRKLSDCRPSRTFNSTDVTPRPSQICLVIDWFLTPPLGILQLYLDVNKFYVNLDHFQQYFSGGQFYC
jgi:hypothetical protein